jgi:hypothetical protein
MKKAGCEAGLEVVLVTPTMTSAVSVVSAMASATPAVMTAAAMSAVSVVPSTVAAPSVVAMTVPAVVIAMIPVTPPWPTVVVAIVVGTAAIIAARHIPAVIRIPTPPMMAIITAIIIVDVDAEAAIANIDAEAVGLRWCRRSKIGGEYDQSAESKCTQCFHKSLLAIVPQGPPEV